MASPPQDAGHLPPSPPDAQPTQSPTALADPSSGGEPAKPHLNGHRPVESVDGHSEASGEDEDDDSEEQDNDDSEDGDESDEDEDEEEEEPALKYERITGAVPELLKKDSASALVISHNIMACQRSCALHIINISDCQRVYRHSELMLESSTFWIFRANA
jgi:hypothetical protein